MLASAQLDLLDALLRARAAARARGVRRGACPSARAPSGARAAGGARRRARARARPARVRAGEIEDAAPDEAEERELLAARERLRHLDGAARRGVRRAQALAPEEGAGVAALLAAGGAALDGVAGVDAALDALAERWRALAYEADDLGGRAARATPRGSRPSRAQLEAVEERLAVLDRLKRKHGGTIAAVLEHAERCRARHDELAGAEVALDGRRRALARRAQAERDGARAALRAARAKAAPRLAARGARAARRAGDGGRGVRGRAATEREPGPTGADAVEFLLAPNPGVPAGAAARDRLRRRALARDARAAGRRRRRLAARRSSSTRSTRASAARPRAPSASGCARSRTGRQVLCITHLPQVASLADAPLLDREGPARRARALTTVAQLAEPRGRR